MLTLTYSAFSLEVVAAAALTRVDRRVGSALKIYIKMLGFRIQMYATISLTWASLVFWF